MKAWGGIHAGLDISVPQGTPLRSFVDGEIVDVKPETAGWGGTIVVRDAKGAEHRISHLSQLDPNLKPGDRLSRGQTYARSGGQKGTFGAGNSTGPHVDYRIRVNGQYVNPLTYSPFS